MKTARPGSPVAAAAAADHRHLEEEQEDADEEAKGEAEAEVVGMGAVVDGARSATWTCRAWRTTTPTARGFA